jgi:cellulose biosynthesis protein BcsQ
MAAAADGAGRTTLIANLAEVLARTGLRVAVFALDPSGAPRASSRVTVVPFGTQPERLVSDVSLLDLPLEPNPAALSDADEVVVVVRAGDDVAAVEANLSRLRPAWRRPPARYLLNRFDARLAAHRVSLRLLRARFGARLLDPPVHFEAHAERLFPKESQAAADIAALARTLVPGSTDAQ